MSPMIPDCGVLTTPRRSPPIKLSENTITSPKVASLPYKSPNYVSAGANITLDTGLSFSFYKSPKLPVTPVRRVNPEPVKVRGFRRSKDNINKGVGHKIKKPKPKSKEQKMKMRNVKQVMKRLKEGNYTPCPWTPANRSPVKKKKASLGGKKKLHVLSSPGVTLLDEESSQDEEGEDGRKFFTSRSRASATVNISRNVLLASKNGDITLKQREGRPFEKKNVGRIVEEEIEKYIASSQNSKSLPEPPSLPSVKANPRPLPTRVPTSPSPMKRRLSPKKVKRLFSAKSLTLSSENTSELQDLEIALRDVEVEKKGTPKKTTAEESGGLRRSPRKLDSGSSTPVKQSPLKGDRFSSPVRRSPRHNSSPARTPTRRSLAKVSSVTPRKATPVKRLSTQSVSSSPRRKSPSKASTVASSVSPSKRSAAVCESSPKKKSPSKVNTAEISGDEPVLKSPESNAVKANGADTSGELTSPKLYPLFDRQNWRSTAPSAKVEKVIQKHLSKQKFSSSQMIIDAGQKEFGIRQCPDCGVVYEIANQEDEAAHNLYHNSVESALKYGGWKNENLVRALDELGGRVIMISSKDPSYCWRKLEEVLKVIDEELGFSEQGALVKENSRAFLYVLSQKIVGCVIGETIQKANKVIPSKTDSQASNRLLCCSQEKYTVYAGVSRVWVLKSHRGKGIATKLVDSMRCNMITNLIIPKDKIAFSDPTESGTQFAEKYSERRDFLVYRR